MRKTIDTKAKSASSSEALFSSMINQRDRVNGELGELALASEGDENEEKVSLNIVQCASNLRVS